MATSGFAATLCWKAAAISLVSSRVLSPCTTTSSQGWVFPQEGHQRAASRIWVMSSLGTASVLKARMLLLVFKAAKSSMLSSLYLPFSWDINRYLRVGLSNDFLGSQGGLPVVNYPRPITPVIARNRLVAPIFCGLKTTPLFKIKLTKAVTR